MFRRKRHTAHMNRQVREQQIMAYYTKIWGKPSRKEPFQHDLEAVPQPIFTLEFPAASATGIWVYATLGMSRCSMKAH